MITFLTVVILIVCFLLGAVILVQNPKGGGLATGFQGAKSAASSAPPTSLRRPRGTLLLHFSCFALWWEVSQGMVLLTLESMRALRLQLQSKLHNKRKPSGCTYCNDTLSAPLTGCRAFGSKLTCLSGSEEERMFGTEIA